ncbi:unnamed protein product [Diatraea saccharalis]|uniref:Uncharacterized protein n=1 Tax=Diatraea saccharalis TaxID=40085 RepID=A0A9N9WFS2_9NEOP|nr:unnamed protein product [Diatraea saccharalis]
MSSAFTVRTARIGAGMNPGQMNRGGQRVRSPHYQKLRVRVIHIRDNRRGQPHRSAMEEPRPGGTAFLITVSPTPGILASVGTLTSSNSITPSIDITVDICWLTMEVNAGERLLQGVLKPVERLLRVEVTPSMAMARRVV